MQCKICGYYEIHHSTCKYRNEPYPPYGASAFVVNTPASDLIQCPSQVPMEPNMEKRLLDLIMNSTASSWSHRELVGQQLLQREHNLIIIQLSDDGLVYIYDCDTEERMCLCTELFDRARNNLVVKYEELITRVQEQQQQKTISNKLKKFFGEDTTTPEQSEQKFCGDCRLLGSCWINQEDHAHEDACPDFKKKD